MKRFLLPILTGVAAVAAHAQESDSVRMYRLQQIEVPATRATLRTPVAYTDLFMMQTGELVNQRFDPALLRGEKGLDILESIVRGYFEQYGEHLQVNVVDTETLRAAQKNPKEYQNILVRVAGYSAYFVELERKVQDDIISRTLQNCV